MLDVRLDRTGNWNRMTMRVVPGRQLWRLYHFVRLRLRNRLLVSGQFQNLMALWDGAETGDRLTFMAENSWIYPEILGKHGEENVCVTQTGGYHLDQQFVIFESWDSHILHLPVHAVCAGWAIMALAERLLPAMIDSFVCVVVSYCL
jgi:hypothetical protein